MGITGHKAQTLGKMYATIDLDGLKIKHSIYLIKDDLFMEYKEMLALDFFQKQQVTYDF